MGNDADKGDALRDKTVLQIVVRGHDVVLAALLMQPNPTPALLPEHVLDVHGNGRADACERIDQLRQVVGIRQ